jgi:hypothetical protein
MKSESGLTASEPRFENRSSENRERLMATGPQSSVRVSLTWTLLTINHNTVVSYCWICKQKFNINSENYGKKIKGSGCKFSLVW